MAPGRADVVIVGARCAGAALAAMLARNGARVIALERDRLHSDQPISTHQIHPPGVDVLDELGVGDAVRSVCAPSRVIRIAKDDAEVNLRLPEGRMELCPRRRRLDGLLQDAAVASGAEVRGGCRVTEVVMEEGRARGVRVASDGCEETIDADLVVGADGRRSTVAEQVGATEYLGYDAPRAMYWTYFQAPESWHDETLFPFDMFVGNWQGRVRTVFQTDDDRLLLGSLPVVEDVPAWRRDPLGALLEDLPRDPRLTPLVRDAGHPVEEVRGTIRERYYFRQGAGPGWLLVGDAGHHKDFVLGDGITEALIQAKTAAVAIAAGTESALQCWWRARDVEAMPLYFQGKDDGAPGPVRELQRVVFRKVARRPDLQARLLRVFEHELPAQEVFSPVQILGWALGAALRGRPGVLRDFFMIGRGAAAANREIAHRKRLLKRLVA